MARIARVVIHDGIFLLTMRPAAVAPILLAACGVFGPDDRKATIELPFCGPAALEITWAAVQRSGRDWEYLGVTNGHASVTVSGRVAVAYGNSLGSNVFYATAEEFGEVKCYRAGPDARILQGSVRDVPASDAFQVTVGPASSIETPFAAFVPDGPVDVVAWTWRVATSIPQRIIVRSGVNLPSGGEIPILDFSANEARAFESATATITGMAGGVFANLFHPRGNAHTLLTGGGNGSIQYYGAPEAVQGPDHYHTLELRDFFGNAPRELTWYYRRARATTLTMGPPANMPTGELLGSTPCTRLRGRMTSQPEYGSFIVVEFAVDPGQVTFTQVRVGVSSAFLGGTPGMWVVDTPDLRSSSGECLVRPASTGWAISATPSSGRFALYLGGPGRDGEVRRWSLGQWSSP
jgi:hypothetical protein